MGLRRRVQTDEKTAQPKSNSPDIGNLGKIVEFINDGMVIPIISNSMRIEQIFRDEKALADQVSDTVEEKDDVLTIDEQLTQIWAGEIEYPMSDNHNLARVVQYYQVEQKDNLSPKTDYLKFLTTYLLDSIEDTDYQDLVSQLRAQKASFSKIVRELDYPRFPQGIEDQIGRASCRERV